MPRPFILSCYNSCRSDKHPVRPYIRSVTPHNQSGSIPAWTRTPLFNTYTPPIPSLSSQSPLQIGVLIIAVHDRRVTNPGEVNTLDPDGEQSGHDTLNQCWVDVVPASATLAQQLPSIGWTYHVYWESVSAECCVLIDGRADRLVYTELAWQRPHYTINILKALLKQTTIPKSELAWQRPHYTINILKAKVTLLKQTAISRSELAWQRPHYTINILKAKVTLLKQTTIPRSELAWQRPHYTINILKAKVTFSDKRQYLGQN